MKASRRYVSKLFLSSRFLLILIIFLLIQFMDFISLCFLVPEVFLIFVNLRFVFCRSVHLMSLVLYVGLMDWQTVFQISVTRVAGLFKPRNFPFDLTLMNYPSKLLFYLFSMVHLDFITRKE